MLPHLSSLAIALVACVVLSECPLDKRGCETRLNDLQTEGDGRT
jgi:hypothetical protein